MSSLQKISLIGGGIIYYLFGQDIKNLITSYYNYVINCFYVEITIDRDKNNMSFAILDYLYDMLQENLTQKQLDNDLSYTLKNGTYNLKIKHDLLNDDELKKSITVLINDKEILFYNKVNIKPLYNNYKLEYQKQLKFLEKIMDIIYQSKQDPGQYVINFSLNDDGNWSKPHVRDHRIIKNMTTKMTEAVDTIKMFMNIETKNDYVSRGIPYKYGLLLSGISGSGKTTIVEKIAMELGMIIYNINLISDKLTNGLLINACISVNKRSIIVFDEFDKAYKQIIKNNTLKISLAGVLSAIDGTIRLPDGCVVIIIINEKLENVILDKLERDALKRAGRIDKEIEFDQIYLL